MYDDYIDYLKNTKDSSGKTLGEEIINGSRNQGGLEMSRIVTYRWYVVFHGVLVVACALASAWELLTYDHSAPLLLSYIAWYSIFDKAF